MIANAEGNLKKNNWVDNQFELHTRLASICNGCYLFRIRFSQSIKRLQQKDTVMSQCPFSFPIPRYTHSASKMFTVLKVTDKAKKTEGIPSGSKEE